MALVREMALTGGGVTGGRQQVGGTWNSAVLVHLLAWDVNRTFSLEISNRLCSINAGWSQPLIFV